MGDSCAPPADDAWRPAHPSVTSTSARSRDGRRVRFLHNWSWGPVTAPVPARVPQGVHDALTGAEYTTEVPLGSWDVRIVQDR